MSPASSGAAVSSCDVPSPWSAPPCFPPQSPPVTDATITSAQSDMRRAYLHGAPGVLASGLVWLAAAGTAAFHSPDTAVIVLLVSGAMIFRSAWC